jgi:hypothetical protein
VNPRPAAFEKHRESLQFDRLRWRAYANEGAVRHKHVHSHIVVMASSDRIDDEIETLNLPLDAVAPLLCAGITTY